MKKQEMFDKVWIHAQKKEKSVDDVGKCMYFNEENGAKCFLGCLLSDEDAKTAEEQGDSKAFELIGMSSFEVMSDSIESFACVIQHVHDRNPTERWNSELRKLAEEYDLKCPT